MLLVVPLLHSTTCAIHVNYMCCWKISTASRGTSSYRYYPYGSSIISLTNDLTLLMSISINI